MSLVSLRATAGWTAVAATILSGCATQQSALAPAGVEAGAVADLTWLLAAGTAAIVALVAALGVLAVTGSSRLRARIARESTVVAGGVLLPVVTLTALLVHGLKTTRALLPEGPPALVVEVIGEQWWWRIHYLGADGAVAATTANELHIPVGEPVDLRLSTADVIHSFWVPRLAGKVDMIPGRVNELRLEAREPGIFRGQCAEYCGGAHALMAFHVVAEPRPAFEAWLARQRAPAELPSDPFLQRGQDAFLAGGCGACHAVRGTPAAGTIGPDLTHVGGRRFLAAGVLPTHVGTIAGWVAASEDIKPQNRMPPAPIFPGEDLRALASWLAALE